MRSVKPAVMILKERCPAGVAGLYRLARTISALLFPPVLPRVKPLPVPVVRDSRQPRRCG